MISIILNLLWCGVFDGQTVVLVNNSFAKNMHLAVGDETSTHVNYIQVTEDTVQIHHVLTDVLPAGSGRHWKPL